MCYLETILFYSNTRNYILLTYPALFAGQYLWLDVFSNIANCFSNSEDISLEFPGEFCSK